MPAILDSTGLEHLPSSQKVLLASADKASITASWFLRRDLPVSGLISSCAVDSVLLSLNLERLTGASHPSVLASGLPLHPSGEEFWSVPQPWR